MEIEGVVQNGVIVPDAECPLPEGTKVHITPTAESNGPQTTIWDRLRELAKKFENEPCALPTDLSVNVDHYLYGMPKRSE